MNLTISGHHLEVTPALREYVLTKLDRVTRHFDQVVDVTVLLKQKEEYGRYFREHLSVFTQQDGYLSKRINLQKLRCASLSLFQVDPDNLVLHLKLVQGDVRSE